MQLLTVYTAEDFFYEDKIKVSLKQDKISENICYLECKRDGRILFEISLHSGIYTNDGVGAVIASQFKMFGINSEFLYSVKRFTYILQPSKPFRSVEFVVSGNKNVCTVTYSVNDSVYSKSAYFFADFNNLVMVRFGIDNLFQMVCQSRTYKKEKFKK